MPLFFRKKKEASLPMPLPTEEDYEDAIRRICREKISLVVNEIKTDGILFKKDKDGFPSEDAGTTVVRGVMYESCRTDFFIPFEMEIENRSLNQREDFGAMSLSKFRNVKQEWMDVSISIRINDYQNNLLTSLKEMVRDAAISHHRFVDIAVLKNEDSFDKHLSHFKEKGYTNHMAVSGVRLWGRLLLPNTPKFAIHDD